MMDLMFNFSSNAIANPYEKQEKPNNKGKNGKVNGSGFSFQFTKNDKVKAVVAKRRVKSNANSEARENTSKNYVTRPPSPSSDEDNSDNQLNGKRNYVMRPRDDDSDDEQTDVPQKQEKPPKLSRAERLNKKRNEKFNARKDRNNKVLTDAEINDGIKKFSKQYEKPMKKQKRPNICNNIETKMFGQKLVKPIVEKVFSGCSLQTLNVHPHLVKDLADLFNIKELTTVQQKVIPKALEGHNLIVRSQTGSGKTLAYALPIVQKLQEITPKITRSSGILALIIVPTRELAIQTYEFLIKLLKPFTWIVSGYLCGGEKRKSEKARLRKGINILVGTTGRLLDHMSQTDSCKLDKLRFLVLDEADRLLELGYERDIAKVMHTIDEQKRNADVADEFRVSKNNDKETSEVPLQRLLLSATLTPAIQKLAGLTLKNPIFIDNSEESPINAETNNTEYEEAVNQAVKDGKLILPENLKLSYVVVHPKLRLATLSGILAKEFKNRKTKVLVFCATTEMVNFHHDLLNEALTTRVLDEEDEPNDDENDETPLLLGVKFFRLHGSMTQQERAGVFKAFKTCSSGILLTTDVAGRGIDVPEVDLVIQYSPPQGLSDFVHRVGRTARAGKSGRAILFLSEDEIEFIRMLEDKQIRISQEILEHFLKNIKDVDNVANTVQEAVSNLQHKFESLIEDDKELREKAYKAYSSWVKNYSAFPKELKPMFNIKKAHKGHYAKSFALKEPPSKFVANYSKPKAALPVNRLTYSDREKTKIKENPDTRKRKHNLSTTVSGGHRVAISTRNRESAFPQQNKFRENKNTIAANKLAEFSRKSIMMTVSEFDSGIPSKKKKN